MLRLLIVRRSGDRHSVADALPDGGHAAGLREAIILVVLSKVARSCSLGNMLV